MQFKYATYFPLFRQFCDTRKKTRIYGILDSGFNILPGGEEDQHFEGSRYYMTQAKRYGRLYNPKYSRLSPSGWSGRMTLNKTNPYCTDHDTCSPF